MKWPLSICHLKHGGQFHYELPQSLDFLRVACSPPCHSGACRTPDGTTAPAICLRNRQRIKEAVRYASYPAYHPTHPWLEWSHHNISQHTQINQDVQLCAWFCRITWMYIYICIYIYVYIYIYIWLYEWWNSHALTGAILILQRHILKSVVNNWSVIPTTFSHKVGLRHRHQFPGKKSSPSNVCCFIHLLDYMKSEYVLIYHYNNYQ